MEGLLHWDFSPGLALEDQVHHHFGSPVHFSPSPHAKEFFLVVSFSSTSFPLTEESVGLALQCCLGGLRSGFRVYQLSDRRFRFSVASNKVGHFIYGLKDRVWPNFVCHFSLFRGVHPAITGFHNGSTSWSSSEQNVVVAQRSRTKLNPKLQVLQESARNDLSGSSDAELSKFGFITKRSYDHGSASSSKSHGNSLSFGSFSDPISTDLDGPIQKHFMGQSFLKKLCEFLPINTLLAIQDLRQAGYSDPDIMESLKIPSVPPNDLISAFIVSCSNCGLDGHHMQDCDRMKSRTCFKCLGPSHVNANCLLGWRCRACRQLGHIARLCPIKQQKIWGVKTWPATRDPTDTAQKIWVVKSRTKGKEINLLTSRRISVPAVLTPLPQSTLQLQPAAMATFPVNPLAFLPEGLTIDQGPADRKVCTDLVVSPNAPLQNDKVIIAETNRFI
jgi:hypothetical protein